MSRGGGAGAALTPVTLLDARSHTDGAVSSYSRSPLAGGSLTDAHGGWAFKVVGSSGIVTAYATAASRRCSTATCLPMTGRLWKKRLQHTTNSENGATDHKALNYKQTIHYNVSGRQRAPGLVIVDDDTTVCGAGPTRCCDSYHYYHGNYHVGGGALTTSEQESLANARVLTSRVFNGAGNGIATLGSGTTWPTNSPNTFVVTATEYADVERIELVFRQNGKVGLPYIITKGVLDEIPAGAFMPNSPTDSQTIRGVFYAGRIGPSHRNTNYWVINPRFDFMEERRGANDNCILIQYGLNGTLFTGVFIRARQPSGGLIFQHAELFYWEDA